MVFNRVKHINCYIFSVKQEKNPLKVIAIVVFVALVMVAGTIAYNNFKNPVKEQVQGQSDVRAQDVTISVTDGQLLTKSYSIKYTANKSALDLLKDLQSQNSDFTFVYSDSQYGAFITGINGYSPDVMTAFWELKINGQSAAVGVSAYQVRPGDNLQFVISKIDPNY